MHQNINVEAAEILDVVQRVKNRVLGGSVNLSNYLLNTVLNDNLGLAY